jgi:PAS domain S-box-containing protein
MAIPSLSSQPLDQFQIFEALPDCYLILSADLVIQAVTDSYLKTTFTRREDLVGRSIFEVFAGSPVTQEAATIQHLAASLQQVLDTKQAHVMPVQQYNLPDLEKTGHFVQRYWKPLNTPVLDKEGNVQYILHKVEDVTLLTMQGHHMKDLQKKGEAMGATARQTHSLWLNEQQHARQAWERLQEEHLRLKEAQALGHIGSFERNYDEEIIYCSDEFYRIHGLEPQSETMNLEKLIAFVHPDDRQAFQESIRLARTEHTPVDLMQRIVWRDGTIRHIHRKAVVFRDEQEIPLGVYGILQDITEQVEAADKLRRSESLLREAEMLGGMGSYEADLSTFSFLFSDNMFRLLGHEPQSIKPTLDWLDSISYPEDALRIRQIIQEAAKEKKPYTYLRRIILPDGQTRYIASQGKVICDQQGNATKIVGTAQDITEQKLAEEELKRKTILLQAIIDTAYGGKALLEPVFNQEGKLVDVIYQMMNRRHASFFSLTGEQMLGQKMLELFPVLQGSIIWSKIVQAWETGEVVLHQDEMHDETIDGYFMFQYVRIENQILVWSIDISDMKRAEQAAQRSEARLRHFIDALPQMAWIASPDGGSTYFNKRTYEYTGLSFEQIRDYGWHQTYDPADIVEVDKVWRQAMATGQPYTHEARMRRYDGQSRWQLGIALPVKDAEGTIDYWAGTVTDIHDRKLAEAQVLESQALLKAVIDASINGIQAFKAIRNEQQEIIDFEWMLTNKLTDTFLRRNDLVGLRLSEQYPGTKKVVIYENIQGVVETGKTSHFEVWYPYEGLHHWFEFIIVKLHDGAVLTFQDITERKRLEEERLQWKLKTQQQLLHGILDAEEREKKRIAESLHNGLGQVLFAAQMHLDIIDPSQPPMNGEQAIRSWNKSYQLLLQAIRLTRTISHELTPTILETFGLQAVIEDMGNYLSTDKLQIYSQLRVHSVLEKHFQTAIYRIAQELANNIVKHARATQATIEVREAEKQIIIEARDNGKGFEAEKETNKGMGLASIRDRVKLLNGYLMINSVIDQGTKVTIRLPLIPSYAEA